MISASLYGFYRKRKSLCRREQGGGHSPRYASVAQLVEQGTENPRVVGSIPIGGTILCGFSSFGRARPCQGRGGGFEPRNPLQRRHSQAVRQRSATPLCPGSNPGDASRKNDLFRQVVFFIDINPAKFSICLAARYTFGSIYCSMAMRSGNLYCIVIFVLCT